MKDSIITDFTSRVQMAKTNWTMICLRCFRINKFFNKKEKYYYKSGKKKLLQDLDFVRMAKQ